MRRPSCTIRAPVAGLRNDVKQAATGKDEGIGRLAAAIGGKVVCDGT
ncbi:hypothetical protein LVY75_33865 (plasmid) [Sinorhizobium sp. B11]